MPGPTPSRLCPICDSSIEKDDEKCKFCGTDLSIFEDEIEEAFEEEERLVSDTFSELEAKTELEEKPAAEEPAIEVEAEAPEAKEPPEEDVIVEEKAEPSKEKPAEEDMQFECPACGGIVTESDKSCPSCGVIFSEEESQFECPACGTLVSADAVRCPGCDALFVEDESAVAAPEVEPISAERYVEEAEVAEEPTAAEAEERPTIKRHLPSVERFRKPAVPKETRPPDKAEEKPEPKKKLKIGLGFFKGLIRREEEPEEKPTPPAGKKPLGERKPKKPSKAEAVPAAGAEKPRVTHEIPKDPREQGKELARMVAEVKALLGIARQRRIDIEESEILIDRAIMAGRERHFVQALQLVSESEEKLHYQFAGYLSLVLESLREEVEIAKKLGGNPSRAIAFMNEANRAAKSVDFQAVMVFINKAKTELAPMTGRYNLTRDALDKFDRLARDAKFIGIDRDEQKALYSEAKEAFDVLDFESAEKKIRTATDNLVTQIPEKMSKEVEKAKQLLLEAKIKTEKSITPQITILKSVRWAMKEEKYIDALAEMKRFKKEMRKLMS